MSGKYYILGDGGLAREIHAYMRSLGCKPKLAGLADESDAIASGEPLVIGLGFPSQRIGAWCKYASLGWRFQPMVFGVSHSEMNPGVIICPGSIITVGCRIGPAVLVNLNCTVGHDCIIGDGTVVNPGANISGNVRIGTGCLIGTGAQILQGLVIGDGATVGAGAVVTHNVQPGTTVIGVPARRMDK